MAAGLVAIRPSAFAALSMGCALIPFSGRLSSSGAGVRVATLARARLERFHIGKREL